MCIDCMCVQYGYEYKEVCVCGREEIREKLNSEAKLEMHFHSWPCKSRIIKKIFHHWIYFPPCMRNKVELNLAHVW